MREIFPEIWETVLFWYSSAYIIWITHNHVILVFLSVIATCNNSDDEFLSALVLCIIYTSERYSDWKPWRNDHVPVVIIFTLFSMVLRDDAGDVLIENNNYGYVIM